MLFRNKVIFHCPCICRQTTCACLWRGTCNLLFCLQLCWLRRCRNSPIFCTDRGLKFFEQHIRRHWIARGDHPRYGKGDHQYGNRQGNQLWIISKGKSRRRRVRIMPGNVNGGAVTGCGIPETEAMKRVTFPGQQAHPNQGCRS